MINKLLSALSYIPKVILTSYPCKLIIDYMDTGLFPRKCNRNAHIDIFQLNLIRGRPFDSEGGPGTFIRDRLFINSFTVSGQ